MIVLIRTVQLATNIVADKTTRQHTTGDGNLVTSAPTNLGTYESSEGSPQPAS